MCTESCWELPMLLLPSGVKLASSIRAHQRGARGHIILLIILNFNFTFTWCGPSLPEKRQQLCTQLIMMETKVDVRRRSIKSDKVGIRRRDGCHCRTSCPIRTVHVQISTEMRGKRAGSLSSYFCRQLQKKIMCLIQNVSECFQQVYVLCMLCAYMFIFMCFR